MILDQPLDQTVLQKLSAAEKVKLLQQAYEEFVQIVQTQRQTEKHLLSEAIHKVEEHKMQQIRQLIQSLQ